jgi:uncharacterized protein
MQFQHGCVLFRSGQFWESHEAWEALWVTLPRSAFKSAIQALIQTAACAVLASQGRWKGLARKQAQALLKVNGLKALGVDAIQGIPLTTVYAIHACLTLEAVQDTDWPALVCRTFREHTPHV